MTEFSNSIDATIKRLGVSRPTVYRLIAGGKLKARKLGGRTVVLESDLLAYLTALPAVQPSAKAA